MFDGRSIRYVCLFIGDMPMYHIHVPYCVYFLRSQITDWLYKVRKCNKGPLCINLNLRRWRRPKKRLPMITKRPILVIWLMIIECPH